MFLIIIVSVLLFHDSFQSSDTDNVVKLCDINPHNIVCGINYTHPRIKEIENRVRVNGKKKSTCSKLSWLSYQDIRDLLSFTNEARNKMAGGHYTHLGMKYPTAANMFEVVSLTQIVITADYQIILSFFRCMTIL